MSFEQNTHSSLLLAHSKKNQNYEQIPDVH